LRQVVAFFLLPFQLLQVMKILNIPIVILNVHKQINKLTELITEQNHQIASTN